jgi:hypothetical protein
MPQPYQRPSVDIGGSAARRDWREVMVRRIEVGDILTKYGLVTDLIEDTGSIILKFKNGTSLTFQSGDTVTAFVKI